MAKRKQPSKPKRVRDADAKVWAKPEMQALDKALNDVLKVSKEELDKRVAEAKKARKKK